MYSIDRDAHSHVSKRAHFGIVLRKIILVVKATCFFLGGKCFFPARIIMYLTMFFRCLMLSWRFGAVRGVTCHNACFAHAFSAPGSLGDPPWGLGPPSPLAPGRGSARMPAASPTTWLREAAFRISCYDGSAGARRRAKWHFALKEYLSQPLQMHVRFCERRSAQNNADQLSH